MKRQWFKWLSLLTGLLYLWLFYQLLVTPDQILPSFGVEADVHTTFLARRISVLMLGFSVLLFLAAWLPQSKARAVIAAAVAVNMAGFAVNSFYGATHGYLTDRAIPVIGSIESLIALSFAFSVAEYLKSRKKAEAPDPTCDKVTTRP